MLDGLCAYNGVMILGLPGRNVYIIVKTLRSAWQDPGIEAKDGYPQGYV